MDISRRTIIAGVSALAASLVTSSAKACSVVARSKPIAFSDTACRHSLRALVNLIQAAPNLSDVELSHRTSELSIDFDGSVSDPILNYPRSFPVEDIDLIRGWSMSYGKQDQSPIRLTELNMLKGQQGAALYQFTFRRILYHPEVTQAEAARDSCGEGAVNAYYYSEDTSYLGLFLNNKLREVSAFDQWLRTI